MLPRPEPLPQPDAGARAHSQRVVDAIREAIADGAGWLRFDAYMQLALHAPGLGYYAAGAHKLGAAGDFVTAPELTPLFGEALASQVARILEVAPGDVLELGAGSGTLATTLLRSLGKPPRRYRILDVSPDLRERQRDTIARTVPSMLSRVEWIDTLPDAIDGAVLMNEVLDAIPVRIVVRRDAQWLERGVVSAGDGFAFEDRPLHDDALRAIAAARFPPDVDYASEINLAAEALVRDIAQRLASGAMLVVDYGFPREEYYHPQRSDGTLMGHYRHRAHADPFLWPGLSDLTAHIDFTAIAEAGVAAGLQVAGFASQAAFLLGCGILDRLAAVGPPESRDYIVQAAAVQKLLSPAEMGDLFKAMALARSGGIDWRGFALADMRRRL